MFLLTKFVEGAWVVVLAVPMFIFMFNRIHTYYENAARLLGFHTVPTKPVGRRTTVVVPVVQVSTLTEHALTEALSLGQDVIAVNVAHDGDTDASGDQTLQEEWAAWDPGVPLRILHTDYASVVEPIVAFIDELRERTDDQIVVLIPVVLPTRLRYRILHNQIDLLLSSALRNRTDIVVARVTSPLGTRGLGV